MKYGVKISRSRLQVLVAGVVSICIASVAGAAETKPDLSGVWVVSGDRHLLKTSDDQLPPLRTEAKAVYQHHIAQRQQGDLSFDTTTRCIPPGIPRIAAVSPFRIVQKPDLVAFMYEWNRRYRIAYLDTYHKYVDDILYLGDSVAKWQGNELVVDVASLNDQTLLDDALPHSEALHVVERYHLADGGRTLSVEYTIEDPMTFSTPWTTTVKFKKQPAGVELKEDVCSDRVNLFGEK